MALSCHPVTPDRWGDLEQLFGPNGAYSNCWCTWWILSNRQWSAAQPAERRALLHDLTSEGAVPGILAYEEDSPVGWVAVGPRQRYARMMSTRAPVNGPLDLDDPGWVVNCFYVPSDLRGHGIAGGLLGAAVDFAFGAGATYLAGHPVDTTDQGRRTADLFVGTLSMFLEAGFSEIGRRGRRPVVRLDRDDYLRA